MVKAGRTRSLGKFFTAESWSPGGLVCSMLVVVIVDGLFFVFCLLSIQKRSTAGAKVMRSSFLSDPSAKSSDELLCSHPHYVYRLTRTPKFAHGERLRKELGIAQRPVRCNYSAFI